MATVLTRGRSDVGGLRRFTTDEYHEMLRVGILRDGEPVELLGGQIRNKMAKSAQHMAATTRTLHAFLRVLPAGWHAVAENAVVLSGYDEPEPDLVVRKGDLPDYDRRKATAEDIALIVEVSASSLDTDRGEKLQAYGAAGLPYYWIVNLKTRCVEVYSGPSQAEGGGYGHREELGEASEVDVTIDGTVVGRIAISAILPSSGSG